jgi:hypothetical protein
MDVDTEKPENCDYCGSESSDIEYWENDRDGYWLCAYCSGGVTKQSDTIFAMARMFGILEQRLKSNVKSEPSGDGSCDKLWDHAHPVWFRDGVLYAMKCIEKLKSFIREQEK